jgi:hypothetical protein
MIVSEPKGPALAWYRLHTGYSPRADATILASIDPDHHYRAVLVFQNWYGPDIEIGTAATTLPRSLLRAAYRYAVTQLGVRRVTFRIRADNTNAIIALGRLGAKQEGVIRKFYKDGCDELLFGVLKEDYPYHG